MAPAQELDWKRLLAALVILVLVCACCKCYSQMRMKEIEEEVEELRKEIEEKNGVKTLDPSKLNGSASTGREAKYQEGNDP